MAPGYTDTRYGYSLLGPTCGEFWTTRAEPDHPPGDTLQSEEWLRSEVATDSWRKIVPTKEKACRVIRKTRSNSTPASRSVTLSTLRRSQTSDAAETWFEENDPEGVAFAHEVLE